MKKIFITLLVSLPLFAGNLQLQEGFVAAHTEATIGGSIDPLNTALQADIHINENDITSLNGKFWIEMNLFFSDNEDRDENMYEAMNTKQFPLATYTLNKVTKTEGTDAYTLEGNLNFFGNERPLTLSAQITFKEGKLVINATSKFLVSDYEMQAPCLLFICVRDEIDLFTKAVFIE